LRFHYIHEHHLPPAEVSRKQRTLMVRRHLPPDAEPPVVPGVREFIRGEEFDPQWPIGPVGEGYGPWMVRGKVDEGLREARERREERNPRGWERLFVPDWYFDEISRRVAMRRGRMWR
jgi:hypothetical protein